MINVEIRFVSRVAEKGKIMRGSKKKKKKGPEGFVSETAAGGPNAPCSKARWRSAEGEREEGDTAVARHANRQAVRAMG